MSMPIDGRSARVSAPRWFAPVLVLLIGIVGSAWGYGRVRHDQSEQLRLDLERRGRIVVAALNEELGQHFRLLDTLGALVTADDDNDGNDEPSPPPDDLVYWASRVSD